MDELSAPETSMFLFLLNCRYEPEFLTDKLHCSPSRQYVCSDIGIWVPFGATEKKYSKRLCRGWNIFRWYENFEKRRSRVDQTPIRLDINGFWLRWWPKPQWLKRVHKMTRMEYIRKVIKIIDNYYVSVVYCHFWEIRSWSEFRYSGWKCYWLQPGERGTVLYHFLRLLNVERSGDMEMYYRRYNIHRRSLEGTHPSQSSSSKPSSAAWQQTPSPVSAYWSAWQILTKFA
jgi:hypothetical protein